MTIDNIIQYGEDCDVKVRDDFDPPEDDDEGEEKFDFMTNPENFVNS